MKLVYLATIAALALPGMAEAKPIAATEAAFEEGPLVLTVQHDYVVNLRREQPTKAGQRPTRRIFVRAPADNLAKAKAQAKHPGYIATNAARQP